MDRFEATLKEGDEAQRALDEKSYPSRGAV